MTVRRRKIFAWWQAARPIAHGMLALPLLLGQVLAWRVAGQFEWLWFLLIHLFGAACQVYILYLNDYADEAVDRQNTAFWFSGGSRVVPNGQLSGKQLYRASFIALSIMVLLGLISAVCGRPLMLLLVAFAAIAAWGYSLKPMRSSYRGYGELHQGLACGVLLPVTAFYLQNGSLHHFPWLMLVPVLLIFYAGNIITALLDRPADASGGKRTYPVRYGEQKARNDALLLLATAYCLCIIISAQYVAWYIMTLLVGGPALLIITYTALSGLLVRADGSNRTACRKFIVLTSSSQAWVMVSWITTLFLWR